MHAEWRSQVGAPEVCPHGATADKLPAVGEQGAEIGERPVTGGQRPTVVAESCWSCPLGHLVQHDNGAVGCRAIGGGAPCSYRKHIGRGGPWPDGCPLAKKGDTSGKLGKPPAKPSSKVF